MAIRLSKDTLNLVKGIVEPNLSVAKDQIRLNHKDCPAGEDRRERLYAKVTEDRSKILCHCFNCGASGVIPLKINPYGMFSTTKAETVEDINKIQIYQEWQSVYSMATPLPVYPYDEQAWPYKTMYGKEYFDWFYSQGFYGMRQTKDGAIMLPRGDTGFDVRWPDKRMKRVIRPGYEHLSSLMVFNNHNSKICIVCEDPVSAMHIDKAGYCGAAVCGSSLSQDDAFKLSMLYDKFIVWFDNDNEQVKINARSALNRIVLYCDEAFIEIALSDPKNYSTEVIKVLVHGVFEEE